jgi:hypothetical protein
MVDVDCTRGHNACIVNVSNAVLPHNPFLLPFAYVPLYAPVYIPVCPQLLQLCSAATIHLACKYLAALS